MIRGHLVLFILLMPLMAWAQWCASSTTNVGSVSSSELVRPRNNVTTIPVVVHVVYRTSEQNISDAQIQSQLDVLNEDFRALNLDLEDVPFSFSGLIADMELEFSLVDVDPSGNPHPGIIRKATQTANLATRIIDGKRAIAYDELGGSDAWCSECYLNIWVGEFADGIAGIGTFPNTVAPEEDGVFVAFDRFGTMGTVTTPYDLGRTAVHEIGHYLNLLHTWGMVADPSLCADDDFVADTPVPDDNYLGECPTGTNQFSCDGGFDMFMNFMTFADDACLLMFTEGQKERVQNSLADFRPVLAGLSPCNCIVDTQEPQAEEYLVKTWWSRGGQLYVELNQMNEAKLELIALNGQVLMSDRQENRLLSLTINHLPAGLYLVRIQTESRGQTIKIIL